MELESRIDDIYFLSEEESNAVNKGIDQLNKGQFISNAEANKRADECLKK